MDDILFTIGLSLTSSRKNYHRRIINHPIVITIASLIWIITSCWLALQTADYELAIKLGDVGHMIKLKRHSNEAKILAGVMVLWFQYINYSNYKRGVKLNFIRVFQAILVLIRPKSIGINTRAEFNKMKHLSKKTFFILNYQNNYFIPSAAMTGIPFVYFIAGESSMIIPYGLVHSLIWAIFGRVFFNVVTYQIFYFCFVCKYLKVKVAQFNKNVKKLKQDIVVQRNIKNILHSYSALFLEINLYNTTYWSKFLLVFWIGFGTFVVIFVHIVLYQDSHIAILLISSYLLTIYSTVFLLVIFTAASVNTAVKKSYPILNSLILIIDHANLTQKSRLRKKLKVKSRKSII